MADAADRFLATLSAEQKAKATFDFDDKERFNWHFLFLSRTPGSGRREKGCRSRT